MTRAAPYGSAHGCVCCAQPVVMFAAKRYTPSSMDIKVQTTRRAVRMAIGQAIAQAKDGVKLLLEFVKSDGFRQAGDSNQADPEPTRGEEDRD